VSGFGRSLASVACAVLVASAQIPGASADETDPGCTSSGRVLRYLVVFDPGTSQTTARGQVHAACGTPTVYYPQISVGVATSADPAFTARFGADRAFSAQAQRRAAGTPRATLPPTDPAEVSGLDLAGDQWDMGAINAAPARRSEPGRPDVVVGVLDSGIDPAHPELSRAIARDQSAGCLSGAPDRAESAWRPTTSPHGTHVAGIIAAADDGRGITGVAPGVRVASLKVINDRGYVDPEAAVCGLMWAAAHHMPITNSSFTVDPWGLPCAERADYRVVHEAVARAVEYSASEGTLNVAVATNEAVNLTSSPRAGVAASPSSSCEALPAGLKDVVTVSAVGPDEVKAGYSSYGLGVVDLAAPGGDRDRCVLSTVPGGYAPLCGTSMAAPHATGVAALVASAHPDYGARQLRDTLYRSARPMPCPTDYDLTGNGHQDAFCAGYTGYNGFYGHGLVDAVGALGGH
jgi:subtilisin family serine protease